MRLWVLLLPVICAAAPVVTPAPAGPYHVEGSRLIDSHGRPYLLNGTRLAQVSASDSDLNGMPGYFGALSATTIVTIRQRLNMNAVRLPVDAALYVEDAAYRRRTRMVVETSNHLELLVVLEASTAAPDFWAMAARDFRESPDVFFALPADANGDAAQCAVDA